MKTRREFMAGAAIMATGAAVGFGCGKVHGPVDFNTNFFGPLTLKGILSSDEKTDSFQIKIVTKYAPHVYVNFKLSEIRRAVTSRVYMQARVSNHEGINDRMPVYALRDGGNMVFVTAMPGDRSPSSFWFDLEDVKRVL